MRANWRSVGLILGLALQPAPPQTATLQSLVDAAAPGSTVAVPAGVYRETVRITKSLTLDGQGSSSIRGSDVWTGWTALGGGVWRSTLTVPVLEDEGALMGDGRCAQAGAPPACQYRESVFVNGAPLQMVSSTPGANQFSLDNSRRVLMGTDPAGETVEVTTRKEWVRAEAHGVTVKGFDMRHSAADSQFGGAITDGWDRFTLENNGLRYSHASPVSLRGATTGHVVRGNTIEFGGEDGISGHPQGALIENNVIAHNGLTHNPGWGAAGVKLGDSRNITFRKNDVHHNPFGLWCDVLCKNITFDGNRVWANHQAGIHFEISDGATIINNQIWDNGWGWQSFVWGAGVVVQTSANALVENNTLAWNYSGISVVSLTRPDRPPSQTGTVVRNNTVIRTIAATDYWANHLFASADDAGGADIAAANPFVHTNRYWSDRAEAGQARYTRYNVGYTTLAAFKTAGSDTTSRYLSDVEACSALQAAGIPTGPVPCTGPTATSTPVPTAAPTMAPTATITVMPTPTPTQTPVPCEVAGWQNGKPVRIPRPTNFCNGAIPTAP